MLKAVIFDMDGVIIDSEIVHMKANLMTLKQYKLVPPDGYFDAFVGTTTEHMFQTIIQDFDLPDSMSKLMELDAVNCKKVYDEIGMVPIPGAISLIKRLAESGLRLAVASSAPMERIEEVCKAFQIRSYFDALVSGCDLAHSKPAPDIFLKAASALHVSPSEAIVIEDSKNGCLAAKAAQIPCIGFISPHSGNQDLYSATLATDSLDALTVTDFHEINQRFNGEPLVIGKTKHFLIRELTLDDSDALFSLKASPEMYRFMDHSDANLSYEEQAEQLCAYIKNVYHFYGYGLWGIFTKDTDTLIGYCGIQNQTILGKDEIELSYMIKKEEQKKGYATEIGRKILKIAEEKYDMNRIVCIIDNRNLASIRVAEKLGMIKECEMDWHQRQCALYAIDIKKVRFESARNQVVKQYDENPDQSVYSKRFTYKKE